MKTLRRLVIIVALGLMLGCAPSNDETALAAIKRCEAQLDSALANFEQKERLEEALAAYREIDADLTRLKLKPDHPQYRKKQSVQAQCLLRLGNMLRQLDKSEEALAVGKRELVAARAAGDTISLARTLMSFGATLITTGEKANGLALMEEARLLFAQDTSYDYRQGLGWYWIIQADLAHAGITSAQPVEVIAFADSALSLLLPLKNWPGVARAYAARARANQLLGNAEVAVADSVEQTKYQTLIGNEKK